VGICKLPSVSCVHNGYFLLHEVLAHERVVRARAPVLDQTGRSTARPEMLAELLKGLRKFLKEKREENRKERGNKHRPNSSL
jgi:hypothetical protein